jgi:hypothetical protein
MNGTSTRARNGRATADPRRDGRHRTYVDGANALQIGYADEVELDEPEPGQRGGLIERELERGRRRRRSTEPDLTPPTIEPKRRPRRRPQGTVEAPVTPPLPISLPRAPFLVLMVSLVVLGVAGVLVLNTKINENAFKLDSLHGQQQNLDLQEQQAKQNLAELEAPGNLRAAATRLGLVPAGTPAFINLPDGRVVGVPQPATGPATPTAGR